MEVTQETIKWMRKGLYIVIALALMAIGLIIWQAENSGNKKYYYYVAIPVGVVVAYSVLLWYLNKHSVIDIFRSPKDTETLDLSSPLDDAERGSFFDTRTDSLVSDF